MGFFVAVGNALFTIRDRRLYREEFKTFEDYCRGKWLISKTHANCLIGGSRVVENLTACAVKPTCEYQIRPLTVLEPDQQCEVWEEAVKTAPAGKVCHFRTPAISVSGGFSDQTAEIASVPSGLCRGRRWPGAVAASGMGPADPWPRGKVTPDLSLGCPLCEPWRACEWH